MIELPIKNGYKKYTTMTLLNKTAIFKGNVSERGMNARPQAWRTQVRFQGGREAWSIVIVSSLNYIYQQKNY